MTRIAACEQDGMEANGKGNIRAISRGLDVLRVINQHRSLSMMSIAKLCSIPYPTACRIVDTLIEERMIEREVSRKRYKPTVHVKALSVGYQEDDDLALAARPHIKELTRNLRWPISVCRRVGMSMMICESTHSIAPFTLNMYYPGYTMPILGSSSGKIYLAYSGEEDRGAILRQVRELSPASADKIIHGLEAEIDTIRARGFGTYDRIRHTANPGKTSAISVPVLVHGQIKGTVTLAFFSSAMTMPQALDAFVPSLKCASAGIEADLAASHAPN